ncbi:Excitatory amino acid transporter 3 [Halotydeus destructor]|nr:Excitatory amino acid transporter 3 [Halotydeus destructor]
MLTTEKKGSWATVAREHLNIILTIVAVVAAILLGLILRQTTDPWSKRDLMYLEFPGEIFLRALKCLILPLIVSSLISSLGNLDAALSGKIGSRAIMYYLASTLTAIFLGIVLVSVVHPGGPSVVGTEVKGPKTRVVTTADTVLDLIRNIFPPNLIEACTVQYSTLLTVPEGSPNETDLSKWTITSSQSSGTNIIGLVAFSILLGIILSRSGEKGKPLLDFFNSLLEASMKITSLVILMTPVGVMFLIVPRIVGVEDVQQMLGGVGWYTFTVLLGLFIHGFLILPAFYYVVTRRNPYHFMAQISPALMTAFGTGSSSATLPVTIQCLERKVQLDSRVVRFLVPIGATINMDGTALYEAVAAIFIAQSRGVDLTLVKLIIISITSTAASVGAAGIPQAGLVTMVIVLNAVGLPAEDVALIYVVDWMLDRFRTAINVLGDSIGSAVIGHLCRDDLSEISDIPATSESKAITEASNITDTSAIDATDKSADYGSIEQIKV